MLSPCKRPDPIYRNPSTQDEPDRKLLPGAIIGLQLHVVTVALIEHTRSCNGSADMKVELIMACNQSQVGVLRFNTKPDVYTVEQIDWVNKTPVIHSQKH